MTFKQWYKVSAEITRKKNENREATREGGRD